MPEQSLKDKRKERKERIDALVQEIQLHQEKYYNGSPSISDADFDALWDRLRSLDPKNEVLKKIGKDSSMFFPKTPHIMPMGSLPKAADQQQFAQWVQKHESTEYVVEYKLDGASLELQYAGGKLRAAVTRGDGKTGDNILINARKMKGVPVDLPYAMTCAIRGEVIMTHKVFLEHFSSEKNAKANCRNAANGLMRKKNGKGVEHLKVICYDIWFDDEQQRWEQELGLNLDVEKVKLQLLRDLKLIAVQHWLCSSEAEINKLRDSTIETRKTVAYDIDGLVVKMSEFKKEDMLTLLPDRQIAYKFPLEQQMTRLLDVEWSESGHLYTPIAVLEPVSIAGTQVKRANLVHPDHIKELGLKIGSEVMVVKRGEIIPKVEKVIFTPSGSTDIKNLPEHCTVCGSAIQNDGSAVYCPNIECRKRLLFRVQRWIAINDIAFWGPALLNKLVLEKKWVSKLGDLYRLEVSDLVKLDLIAKPLAQKLYDSLHKRKRVSLANFIASLGIDGIALLSSESLIRTKFTSIQLLQEATEQELSAIENIGPILAKNIVSTLRFLHAEIEDLLTIIEIEESDREKTAMSGLSFCFTGALSVPRKELQELARKNGGIVKNSVSEDLRYLVCNDKSSSSSKMQEAKKKGIAVLSEEEFSALLE